jgi:2-polyprenyl-3-methyl-5-hydroxy-6-metoxy-1,4-benzoquinol methylase
MASNHNPERNQDRVFDLYDHFTRFGDVFIDNQRRIYQRIAAQICGRSVLEAGCGTGVGSIILAEEAKGFLGTDKSAYNIAMARCLYPHLRFDIWDLNQPSPVEEAYDCVVCVEAIEHVANLHAALKNMADSAYRELWISTPNGAGKYRPCNNPYHVCEYTPSEMIEAVSSAISRYCCVSIYDPVTWSQVETDTLESPLIYHVGLR